MFTVISVNRELSLPSPVMLPTATGFVGFEVKNELKSPDISIFLIIPQFSPAITPA